MNIIQAGQAALPGVRWAGLIDSEGSPLPEAVWAGFEEVFTNAYAAGVPDCFIRVRPGAGDHLFAARLLLRRDVPSLAVEPAEPEDPLEAALAGYWLRRSRVVGREQVWAVAAGLIGQPRAAAASAVTIFRSAPSLVQLLSPRTGRAVFVIGNRAADAALIGLLRRFGGDAVLTSACLLAAYGDARARALAEAELARPVPADELAQWRDGVARPGALLLGEVAAAARELFVPSAWMAAEIARRYGRTAQVLPIPAAVEAGGATGIAAAAAGLQAEACIWALELLQFWGIATPMWLDCPARERAALAGLARRLGVEVNFGRGPGRVAVVLAMRGGEAREQEFVAAAGRNCVASQCLVESVGAPAWVWAVPDQASPPLLAAALRAALAVPAPNATAWAAAHDPAAVAAHLA